MKPERTIQALGITALAIAGYQTYLHYRPATTAPAFCDLNGFWNCSSVMSSSYGYVFGIPVAVIGLIGISALLFLTFLNETKKRNTLLVAGSGAGASFCAYLTFAEFFILRMACPLCLTIFGIMLILLILTLYHWRQDARDYLKKVEIID